MVVSSRPAARFCASANPSTVKETASAPSRMRAAYVESSSVGSSAATRMRWFGSAVTSPSSWSIRSTSRNGVRLTPSWSASVAWDSLVPGGSLPSRTAARR